MLLLVSKPGTHVLSVLGREFKARMNKKTHGSFSCHHFSAPHPISLSFSLTLSFSLSPSSLYFSLSNFSQWFPSWHHLWFLCVCLSLSVSLHDAHTSYNNIVHPEQAHGHSAGLPAQGAWTSDGWALYSPGLFFSPPG